MTTHEALSEGMITASGRLARPVEQWREIYREQTDGSPTGIASRIMADMWGYGTRSDFRVQDIVTLANALLAFEQEYGAVTELQRRRRVIGP